MAAYNNGFVGEQNFSQQQGYVSGQYVQQGPVQGQPLMIANPQAQTMMNTYPPTYEHTQIGIYPQPQQVRWMERPTVHGCPYGLEYLTQIDQLLVKQRIELFEVLTGFETNNKYDIKNAFGQTIYRAIEDSTCCQRYWCGPNRSFLIHIYDNLNTEVMTIRRKYKCHCFGKCLSCSECSQDEVEIEAPPGVVVGYVRQKYEGCHVRYKIMDDKRHTVLRIHGPSYCHCYCPGDEYPLYLMSANGEVEVGKIAKQWSNLIQEYFTDADNFGILFPMDLEVKVKAVVLGAVFLIDFMFFERGNDRRHRRY